MVCRLCDNGFHEAASLVICEHHEGAVHYGCCTESCSQHGEPCAHSHGVFSKQ